MFPYTDLTFRLYQQHAQELMEDATRQRLIKAALQHHNGVQQPRVVQLRRHISFWWCVLRQAIRPQREVAEDACCLCS